MSRKQRYLVEFNTKQGLDILDQMMLVPQDCTRKVPTRGLPGHPEHGMIFHGSAAQMHELEKRLRFAIFDPYQINCVKL